ncbi:MAG: DNA primase [Chloroflexi bacterium RBG_16_48_8]|nr:MAG: DNA primase [Chloroflexi bacterium RBG_16_48_8]
MSVIDEIRDRIDIVEIVSETVKLRKSGKNYTGFCPFHPNTRTPAFVVFPETGTWRCFGACNEGGDVFGFLMKKEGWDFPETLRYLAQRAGIQLQERTPIEEEREEAHQKLRELLEAASVFYRHQLLQSEEGASVLEYLHGRAFTHETLEVFEIGYSPKSWDATRTHLMGKGYSDKDLLDAGMVSERETGGTYDRFRHRIMIPIRDARGRLAGFGARAIDPEDQPKFLNSPQTDLFDKGGLLYGLDKARKAIRSSDQVVIVEGYMDVMALHQAGFENAVSPMGTALSEGQLRLLKRFTRNVVLALDPDAAGSKATLRGLDVARETFDRDVDPVFDARGLLRHEKRLDAELRVITLPQGKDPDEVVAEDPSAWSTLIKSARPIVDYVIDVLSEDQNLDDAKTKAEIARQVLPLIEDIADSVEREAYRQHLARKLRVDERALLSSRSSKSSRGASPTMSTSKMGEEVQSRGKDIPHERFCLGLLLQNPELLYRINRQFQALQLDRLTHADFSGTAHKVIFQAIDKALNQDEEEPINYWRSVLDESLIEVADSILMDLEHLARFAGLDLERQKVADEVSARFMQLRKQNLESELNRLQFLLRTAIEMDVSEADIEINIGNYKREVQLHAIQKAKLEQALAKRQGSLLTAT